MTMLTKILMTLSMCGAIAPGVEDTTLFSTKLPDFANSHNLFLPALTGNAMSGSTVDVTIQLLAMLQHATMNQTAPILQSISGTIQSTMNSWTPSSSSRRRWRSKIQDVTRRYLGWTNGGDAYDLSRSHYAQDASSEWTAKTMFFWFITAFSNSFAVGFGFKAALQGVHPKWHFSTVMARSMLFHIVIGSVEFVWVVIMYLSVPQWWHAVVLVLLDSIQNVTIWIQMSNSQGVKMVTNSCYLFCLVVKAMCCGLLLVDPMSRDLVWAIYEILSAFTLTRISGMSFKKLALFQGQMYTLAVFTATMICAAQAFGTSGPFALYIFLIVYSAAHSQPGSKRKRSSKGKKARSSKVAQSTSTSTSTAAAQPVSWTEEAQRNPFRDEHSMALIRSLLKEGDQQRASPQQRAQIVFQIMTGGDSKWMNRQQLAEVLCPSGVSPKEVDSAFAELSTPITTNDPNANVHGQRGIHFETFFSALPTVWDWYFDYIYESVFHPERQIR